MRVLWLTGAVMQLAAAIAYGVEGLGVVFGLLQLFVFATCALAVTEVLKAPRGASERPDWLSEEVGRLIRDRRYGGGRR